MAPDPNTADDLAWAGLPTTAGNGQLMLEPGIAEKCAQHVEDMLNVVVGMQNWILANTAAACPIITSPLFSGIWLGTMFRNKFENELKDRIGQHRNILVDMGRTFVAAGKQYQQAEQTSTMIFENDDLFTNPAGTPPSGTPPVISIPKHPHKPNSSSTLYDTAYWTPEPGPGIPWHTLYLTGQSINSQAVANAGGIWYWLSQTLDTGFGTLRSQISAASDQWTGQGAQSAILATNQYVNASQRLTSDMHQLGDSLVYTSGWLQQTKNGMPPTPEPPPGTTPAQLSQNQADLIQYQENFHTYYTENYTHVSTRIVVLPQPSQVALPAQDPADPNGEPAPPATDPQDSPPGETPPGNTNGDNSNEPPPDGGGGNGETPPGDHPSTGGNSGGDNPPEGSTPPAEHQPSGSEPNTGTPNLANLNDKDQFPADLSTTPSDGLPMVLSTVPPPNPGGLPGRSGGFGGRGPSLLSAEEKLLRSESKLFPRAAGLPKEEFVGRAGPGSGRGSGFPLGGAPGRAKDEEKEKKKSDYLNSTEHLEEALGGPGRGVKPVLER
ncbi:hypothetical protein OHB26_21435 [Nocardia sp. NBC_01503]|uniref:WXG100 family type VII secretion target n=1 Tax=Nocardia sp. NBC_01503 TaxID=2975997 RepID=UPI002E7B8DE6|nr:hypothetical protein [Nocardia sp. NBC_01503]WTL29549.1 hypothetical protein OHB26_21435 [Nocardia sp. NBC_01503]